ncbi:hypothetical protein [Marinobacterium iners]|uniref:YkuD domain-containing protein n=1 Tax=Marinobacterium iners DSM 11526 TaxID=1122198 RepID=A0A1H3X6U1_9GAMM|nr:hypothetical protein [Marinobacterium iners]SDZ94993.1 hypothetical protein SAMN02745729_10156 [Marinobacterium iners DSM 11526]
MKPLSYEQLQQACSARGYRFFDDGNYNLNIIGVRSADLQANTFNDLIYIAWRVAGEPIVVSLPATTDPGVYWRENLANAAGTGFLVPGQYSGAFRVGKHKGYHALVQARELPLYRDADRDAKLEPNESSIQTGYFGINLHRARVDGRSNLVDRWSAGCQVVADSSDFDLLMSLVDIASKHWGETFTYTLLDEQLLKGVH